MASELKINQTVRVDGKTYGPGDEDELNQVLSAEDVERLLQKGALSGPFTGIDPETGEEGEGVEGAENMPRPMGAPREPGEGEGDQSPSVQNNQLPDGFPGRNTLVSSGYDTMDKVRALTDAQIDEIPKLKAETREKIKEARRQ